MGIQEEFYYTSTPVSPWLNKLSESRDWLEVLKESDWLRNKRGVVSLDQYEDYLCLFRCLAVHEGSRPDRCARRTRQLVQSFFEVHPNFRPPPPVDRGNRVEQPPIGVDKLDLVEQHFQQGIAAYTVTPARDFVSAHAPAHYDQIGRPTMTIGIFEEHAFLITDINKSNQQLYLRRLRC